MRNGQSMITLYNPLIKHLRIRSWYQCWQFHSLVNLTGLNMSWARVWRYLHAAMFPIMPPSMPSTNTITATPRPSKSPCAPLSHAVFYPWQPTRLGIASQNVQNVSPPSDPTFPGKPLAHWTHPGYVSELDSTHLLPHFPCLCHLPSVIPMSNLRL